MKLMKQNEFVKLVGISRQGLQKVIKSGRFKEGKDYIRVSGTPIIILNNKTKKFRPSKPGK
jgi:predicted DNA-binding protein (UPF0251 family)